MAEADPTRKRGIGSEKLVTKEPTHVEKLLATGEYVEAVRLSPGQWSVGHKETIKLVLPKADGSYVVVLNDAEATEIPLERDDGLVVLPERPASD